MSMVHMEAQSMLKDHLYERHALTFSCWYTDCLKHARPIFITPPGVMAALEVTEYVKDRRIRSDLVYKTEADGIVMRIEVFHSHRAVRGSRGDLPFIEVNASHVVDTIKRGGLNFACQPPLGEVRCPTCAAVTAATRAASSAKRALSGAFESVRKARARRASRHAAVTANRANSNAALVSGDMDRMMLSLVCRHAATSAAQAAASANLFAEQAAESGSIASVVRTEMLQQVVMQRWQERAAEAAASANRFAAQEAQRLADTLRLAVSVARGASSAAVRFAHVAAVGTKMPLTPRSGLTARATHAHNMRTSGEISAVTDTATGGVRSLRLDNPQGIINTYNCSGAKRKRQALLCYSAI
jgi:hypothetical protein